MMIFFFERSIAPAMGQPLNRLQESLILFDPHLRLDSYSNEAVAESIVFKHFLAFDPVHLAAQGKTHQPKQSLTSIHIRSLHEQSKTLFIEVPTRE